MGVYEVYMLFDLACETQIVFNSSSYNKKNIAKCILCVFIRINTSPITPWV